MNLSSFIGLRYTRARRRNGFISFISAVSTIGIALGVWALITVMSVMNGFERELRGRILDVASHVTIVGYGGRLANWQAIEAENAQIAGVAATAPFWTMQSEFNGRLIATVFPRRPMIRPTVV